MPLRSIPNSLFTRQNLTAVMADQTEPSSTSERTNTTSPEASSSSSTSPTSQCAQCAKSPDTLKQCLKCHSVAYCGKDCQKAHFKMHKKVCASLAQEYVKANEPKMASRSTAGAKAGGRERGLQKWQFDT
ncbi:MYND-type zinc finger protein samB [Parastagonospora nodorum]|nr:MYND-type zinc finger protein samB [Parastagonospora nodorum]KAH3984237.1 MYND-type zinc finger protein samB [Parastagonospora nodorum]KAH4126867.1 MYND-type zinc finger protein samB [Parastagonospora nodorum]KAH5027766.1 MYND-type zinc finger protein samB [Parastagonospora nodorum]KAH5213936.1 MYND-type zinc finger protein samB [Parastagonospora nodorum]